MLARWEWLIVELLVLGLLLFELVRIRRAVRRDRAAKAAKAPPPAA